MHLGLRVAPLTRILRDVHMWVGLFNLTALIVFAVTGIQVTLLPAPSERTEPAPVVQEIEYRAAPGFTDLQVAADLRTRLALPLSGPTPEKDVRRDEQNRLVLRFYSPNGVQRVTLLEDQDKVRVEHVRNSLGRFMNLMHRAKFSRSEPDLRLRLWGLYVNLAAFSLLFMCVSGAWLWLATRPKLWWARASFAAGTGVFLLLWVLNR
jgi:hypothetical protein